MKKKLFISLLLFLSHFSLFIWASSSQWLIRFNNSVEISSKEFEKEFDAFIEYQKMLDLSISDDSLDSFKKDPLKKKAFLYNYINELLVIQDAEEKKLFDSSVLDQKVEKLKETLKRNFIKQIYVNKYIRNQVTLNINLVEKYYLEINEDPKTKDLSLSEKKNLAEKKAFQKEIELKFIEIINDLKNKNRIQVNDDLIF